MVAWLVVMFVGWLVTIHMNMFENKSNTVRLQKHNLIQQRDLLVGEIVRLVDVINHVTKYGWLLGWLFVWSSCLKVECHCLLMWW